MVTTFRATEGFTVDQGSISVSQFHDGPISFDLTARLDEGETPTNPVFALRLLPTVAGGDETDFPAGLVGSPGIAGNIVSQRVAGLTFGRVYRLVLTFGAAGDRRSTEVFVRVVA